MSRQRIEALLWSFALAGGAVTVARVHARGHHDDPMLVHPVNVVSDPRRYDEDLLLTTAESIASNDPFRLRRPSLALGPTAPTIPAASAPPRAVPHLTLGGVVGGPPWRAVVGGLPGRDGSVIVTIGDTIGTFQVRSIRRDTVIIASRDTTWTLTGGH